MGREDEVAETPRRLNLPGGSRGKRSAPRTMPPPPPPSGSLKYDPTQPSSTPPSAYAYGNGRDISYSHNNEYTAYPSTRGEEAGSNKRKRVKKKEREGAWAPPPPPPPPPPFEVVGARGEDDVIHGAMPAILSRSSSVSSAHNYEQAYVDTIGSTSVFNEVPVAIHSFAETERRRTSASSSQSGSGNAVNLSNLVHGGETATTRPVAPKHQAENGAGWNGKAASHSRSGKLSVFDLFFPAAHQQGTASGTRQAKRRRRNTGEPEKMSGTRSNTRRSREEPPEVDLHQFAVDKFRLIPPGLVDRIDSRLTPSQIHKLISDHVENWVSRLRFDDQNFVQEITSLLNAYYPCPHPTILDDVLAMVVFKRPELTDRLLGSMIERLQKTGESASSARYPVIEAFARRCAAPVAASEKARHDLACLTVLRLLLERNTEKYLLSPWIASCASYCSEEVLRTMWEALLRASVESDTKADNKTWQVTESMDQLFELLREEKSLSRQAGDLAVYRLSRSLLHALYIGPNSTIFQSLRETQVVCEAFGNIFGSSTSVRKLLKDWADVERKDATSTGDAVMRIVSVAAKHCERLSVKKTNWFVRHVLPFALEAAFDSDSDMHMVVQGIVLRHATLLLGHAEKTEIGELEQGVSESKSIVVGSKQSSERYSEDDVAAQLESLRGVLRHSVMFRVSRKFIELWSDEWLRDDVAIPWSYAWGLVKFAVDNVTAETSKASELPFLSLAVKISSRYAWWAITWPNSIAAVPRVSKMAAVAVKVPSTEASKALLRGVLDGVLMADSSSSVSRKIQNAVAAVITGRISSALSGKNYEDAAVLMNSVADMARADDATGAFVRTAVLSQRRIDGIVLQVANDGNGVAIEAAMSMVASVCAIKSTGTKNHAALVGPSTIENLVMVAYRSSLLASTRQRAISLLSAASSVSQTLASTVLWAVIRLCSNYCCGCKGPSPVTSDVTEIVNGFACLSKVLLCRVSTEVIPRVGEFIVDRMASCAKEAGRWNLFTTLLLDRVLQLGWQRIASAPQLLQLVIGPFADSVDSNARVEDQLLQLRLLRTLCTVLVANDRCQTSHENVQWTSTARLATSRPVATRLQRIATSGSCATSASLAQSILLLCESIEVPTTEPIQQLDNSTLRQKLVL